jgi:hypothetical protein
LITARQYQAAQATITARVLALTVGAFLVRGVPLTTVERRRFAAGVFDRFESERGLSYMLAVRHMQYSASSSGVSLPEVARIAPYDSDAVVQVLERVTEPARALDVSDRVVVRHVADNAGAALARHAHQAGRDAVKDTAQSAGVRVGWTRVLTGAENCGFCAMLASRGPVYRSEGSAKFLTHDHCDCRPQLVFRDRPWDGMEQYETLSKLWASSTKRLSGDAARKAFSAAFAAA